MKEIEFSRWPFELPARQHSQFSPSDSTFLPCLCLTSKSHRENSISSIFLESPHQVDMKNVVKSSKHFLGISILQKLTCAAPSVVQGPKQSLRQQFQQQLFSLFQLETKTIFTNNVGHYGLQSQNNFWILFHNPSPPSAILNNFVIL